MALRVLIGAGFLLAAAFSVSNLLDPSPSWKNYVATFGWAIAGLLSIASAALDHRRAR